APHSRNRTKRAKSIAPLRDLQVGIMAWRYTQTRCVFEGPHRRGAEETALLGSLNKGGVHDIGDVFSPQDADHVIDLRYLLQQIVFLPFSEATGDDDGADAALLFELKHLADDAQRLLPCWLDEAAGVDHHHVGAVRVCNERIAVLRQPA